MGAGGALVKVSAQIHESNENSSSHMSTSFLFNAANHKRKREGIILINNNMCLSTNDNKIVFSYCNPMIVLVMTFLNLSIGHGM